MSNKRYDVDENNIEFAQTIDLLYIAKELKCIKKLLTINSPIQSIVVKHVDNILNELGWDIGMWPYLITESFKYTKKLIYSQDIESNKGISLKRRSD